MRDDLVKIAVVLFMVIGVPMLSIFVLPPLAKAWGRRLEGRAGRIDEETAAELADLHARVGELADLQARMAELEERLEFAERLLATRREADQLPGAP
jgi:Tfp pilus assembly protein PilO